MDRTEFFELAKARGWTPGTKLPPAQRTGIVADIRSQLTAPALAQARVHESQGSRPMSALEAVTALFEELDAVQK